MSFPVVVSSICVVLMVLMIAFVLRRRGISMPGGGGAFKTIAVVVVCVLFYRGCVSSGGKKPETTRPRASAPVYRIPDVPTPRTIEIVGEVGVPVYLRQGWRGFTQGGPITITTPDGKVYHDQPGVPTKMGYQPDGVFIFRADPVGSERRVVIYNRW